MTMVKSIEMSRYVNVIRGRGGRMVNALFMSNLENGLMMTVLL